MENETETQDVATVHLGKPVRGCAACKLRVCGRRERPNSCGQVHLTVRNRLGQNVLPAGEYSITMDSSAEAALVRSANGKTVGFTPSPMKADSDKGATALLIIDRASERRVSSLTL